VLRGIVEDMVHGNEDGSALLDGQSGVVVDVDGDGAAANVLRLLQDGDVDGHTLLSGISLQVIGGRGSSSASACTEDWEASAMGGLRAIVSTAALFSYR